VIILHVLVVLDTSVITAGLRSRNGASNAVLTQIASDNLRIAASPPLFLEYEDVLLRPEQMEVHKLTSREVGLFLSELAALIEPVQIHFRWRPQLVDPADEMVLEAAINAGADAIVTHNLRHFAAAAGQFRVKIFSPGELLRKLRI
jgi:putative PIN family toxin of toxin-antitoxin system